MKSTSGIDAFKCLTLAALLALQAAGSFCSAKENSYPDAIMPAPPTVTAEIKREPAHYIDFQTSKAVWKRTSSLANSRDIGYLGPLLIPLSVVILAIDVAAWAVTVPYDILSSPFRAREYKQVIYWKVVGRVTDKAGKGMPKFPLRVNIGVMPPEGNSISRGGQEFVSTGEDGGFTALVSGDAPETSADRIDLTIYVGHESSYTRSLARVGTNAEKPTAPEDYLWSEYGDPRDPKVYLEKFARIKPALETTKDPKEFISYAKKVDSRYPLECLDPIMDRFDEFYYFDTRNLKDKKFANPQDIFNTQSQVIAYMKARDGHRLKVAIGILKRMFLLDRDREAIREALLFKYPNASPEIRKEMIELVLSFDEKNKDRTIALLESLLKMEGRKELSTEIETGLKGLRAPAPAEAQRKWKFMEPDVDKRGGCVTFPCGKRTFRSDDYRGIAELEVVGSTGVIFSRKYAPARQHTEESMPGIKPGKYNYITIGSHGERNEFCFEIVGLDATPTIKTVRKDGDMLNFDLKLDILSQNGLAKAELFDADMISKVFSRENRPGLRLSVRSEQLPRSYLLQLTDKAGVTVQKELVVKTDENGKLSLWEGESSFNAAVRKGGDVTVAIGPWLTARFNKVSAAGNIAVTLSRTDWNLAGKVMAIPRGIMLSGGALLSFDKVFLTFKVDPKSFSHEQLERLSVHQLNGDQDTPTTANMLPARLDVAKGFAMVETSQLGGYVLLVPGYKKLHVLKSKKMVGGKPEAEIITPLDIELIEAPRIPAERVQDIPEGAKLISQAYGFTAKSKEFSAPTDIILRFDPKTKPCPEKERPNLKIIHFGMPNYGCSPEGDGNDSLGERYGELGNIDELGFLVALACVS